MEPSPAPYWRAGAWWIATSAGAMLLEPSRRDWRRHRCWWRWRGHGARTGTWQPSLRKAALAALSAAAAGRSC